MCVVCVCVCVVCVCVLCVWLKYIAVVSRGSMEKDKLVFDLTQPDPRDTQGRKHACLKL